MAAKSNPTGMLCLDASSTKLKGNLVCHLPEGCTTSTKVGGGGVSLRTTPPPAEIDGARVSSIWVLVNNVALLP